MRKKRPMKIAGIHAIDTEVRDFDVALIAIGQAQRRQRAWATRRAKAEAAGKPPVTLKQELAFADYRTRVKLGLAEGPHRGNRRLNLPHPLKDLEPEAKAVKVREMYDHGAGYWGFGPVAFRRLARAFRVPVGQIIDWLRGDA